MSLRDEIMALYREDPTLSGKDILARLGRRGTRQEWRILEDVQVGIRGNYPAVRKNRNKFVIRHGKGITHFIPLPPLD